MAASKRSLRPEVAVLRRECPLDAPVRVVSRAFPDNMRLGDEVGRYFGYCYRGPRGYVIHVDNRQTHYNRVEVLIHEWAHCMCYVASKLAGETNDHGPLFGLAYSRVYSAVEAASEPSHQSVVDKLLHQF